MASVDSFPVRLVETRDHIGDVIVSTVKLGSLTTSPYQTLVVGSCSENDREERYPTEAEALAGHEWWVARVREAQR